MLRQICQRAHVQGLKDYRLTIRENKVQGLVSFEDASMSPNKSRFIVPATLLVRVQ